MNPAKESDVQQPTYAISEPVESPPDDQAAVSCRELTKQYGEVVAVDGVTFSLRRGTVTGFLAPTEPARRRRCGSSWGSQNRPAARLWSSVTATGSW